MDRLMEIRSMIRELGNGGRVGKHWENIKKFGSCPLRRTALLSTFNSLGCSLGCLGFSHFWPIALEFCSAHAGSVHGVVWRLYFASRNQNRVVFRVAMGR